MAVAPPERWAQLTQGPSRQVCAWITALLSGTCNLGFVAELHWQLKKGT